MSTAAAIAELMARYNEARKKWLAHYGAAFNEAEFHAWFTDQATNPRGQEPKP